MKSRDFLVGTAVVAALVVAAVAILFLRDSGRSLPASVQAPTTTPPAPTACSYSTEAPPSLRRAVDACTLAMLAKITPPSPAPQPTRSGILYPEKFDNAVRWAAEDFMGGAEARSDLRSVSYVETTVGEARKLLTPSSRMSPDVPDGVPAWAFVAYGQFQDFCMGCSVHYSPIYTTIAVVVPKTFEGKFVTGGDQRYDLTQLGTEHEVPAALLKQICDERVSPPGQARVCGVYGGASGG